MTTETLAHRLQHGPLSPDEALRLAVDLCDGLRAAHARGRVAGTLAPERLVLEDERWTVTGLERPARGDEREDVRALGELLYTALGSPAPLEMPRDLRAPILRSRHEQPGRRYGTVEEMVRALGLHPEPPKPRRVRTPVLPALTLALAAGIVTRQSLPDPMPRVGVVARAAPAAKAPTVAVTVARFAAPADEPWLGAGVSDMIATVLAERPGVSLVDAEAGDATVSGRVEIAGDGFVIEARLVAGGGTRWAERLAVADRAGLLAAADGLADRLARGVGAGPGPSLGALTTGSVEAYRALIEGDAGRAAALDPTFFAPRARLADLDGARALVGRAGRRGAARLAALETAARARASRAAGRYADCVVDAEPAGLWNDLAWCRVGLGDLDGARAAAERSGDRVLGGDLALLQARYGEARVAYAGVPSRLALLELKARGRCRTPVAVKDAADARVEAALARACGDWDRARGVETWAAARDRDLAAELAALRLAARQPAARARRGSEEAAPGDRYGLFEDPRLWNVALAQIEAGDAEGGALACGELQAASPGWTPALYCLGRAAEAAGDTPGAFRAYRELLDRWAGADEENRLVRDATRHLKMVIARARQGS